MAARFQRHQGMFVRKRLGEQTLTTSGFTASSMAADRPTRMHSRIFLPAPAPGKAAVTDSHQFQIVAGAVVRSRTLSATWPAPMIATRSGELVLHFSQRPLSRYATRPKNHGTLGRIFRPDTPFVHYIALIVTARSCSNSAWKSRVPLPGW